jgi:transposase InsO family protein
VLVDIPPTSGAMWSLDNDHIAAQVAQVERASIALTLDEIHHRLGHVSQDKLLRMLSKKQLEGVTVKGNKELTPCYGCAMGKQKRHVLKTDTDKPTTRKLELIHLDIMGPFRTPTREGHVYVLTVIDDYSRFCWIFPMVHKREAAELFTAWVGQSKREFGKKLWRIRSDNGKEFKNDYLTTFCSQNFYHQEFTNAYTP